MEEEFDWEEGLDNLPILYQWVGHAVNRFLKYSRAHPTCVPMALICRAAFTGMHADDVGGGARYSSTVAHQLREVVVQAKALNEPFERALALMMIAVYDKHPTDRGNALRQCEKLLNDHGATYYSDVAKRLREIMPKGGGSDRSMLPKMLKASSSGLPDGGGGASKVGAGLPTFLPRRLGRKFSFTYGGIRPPFYDLCSLERVRPSGQHVTITVPTTAASPGASPNPGGGRGGLVPLSVVAPESRALTEAVGFDAASSPSAASVVSAVSSRRASSDFEAVGLAKHL